MESKNIIVIVGPTGVGKTKLSILLAHKLNGEIINADSMQFYKGLNIGTAKIKEEEKDGIVHHLFDIVDVNSMYTIYDYQKDGRKVIDDVFSRGKTPIIVGGSGLYIRALLYDYKLEYEEQTLNFDGISNDELYEKCLSIDVNCDIHKNNRKRMERFIIKKINNNEIVKDSKPIYNFKMIGLTTIRSKLYDIINNRVDTMIKDGLLDEVKSFYDKNIRSKAIMTGIGYKEIYSYLDGNISFDESIELIKKNSRHLAKRQYTFFNHQLPVVWFETDYDNFNNTIEKVSNYIDSN